MTLMHQYQKGNVNGINGINGKENEKRKRTDETLAHACKGKGSYDTCAMSILYMIPYHTVPGPPYPSPVQEEGPRRDMEL